MQTLISIQGKNYFKVFTQELAQSSGSSKSQYPKQALLKSIQDNNYSDFVTLLLKYLLDTGSQSSGNYVITFSALSNISSPTLLKETIHKIIQIAVNQKNTNGFDVIVRVLITALNNVKQSNDRLPLFLAILHLAEKEHKLNLMPEFIKEADKLTQKWHLSIDGTIQLLLQVIRINQDNSFCYLSAYRHKLYILNLLGEKSQAVENRSRLTNGGKEAVEFAKSAVVQALSMPQIIEFQNLTSSTFIKANLKDAPQLYGLLQLFEKGNFSNFKKWMSSSTNVKQLQLYKLKEEHLFKKMRFLSLCELAQSKKTASFKEIGQHLDIKIQDVEDWVMDAVTSKIIRGKIDQIEEQVTFASFSLRGMNSDKWRQIQGQLEGLRSRFQQAIPTIPNGDPQ